MEEMNEYENEAIIELLQSACGLGMRLVLSMRMRLLLSYCRINACGLGMRLILLERMNGNETSIEYSIVCMNGNETRIETSVVCMNGNETRIETSVVCMNGNEPVYLWNVFIHFYFFSMK